MIDFFINLPLGPKIAWGVLAIILVISIIVAISQRGREGGIGAGVVSGLALYTFLSRGIIPLNLKWLDNLAPYFRIPIIVVAIVVFLFVCIIMLMGSQELIKKTKPGAGKAILAVLLRIISVAGFTVLGALAISKIGDAGFIVF